MRRGYNITYIYVHLCAFSYLANLSKGRDAKLSV